MSQARPQKPVLVGVVNRKRDLRFLEESHWYRIPVASAPMKHWPPRWVAFYESTRLGAPAQIVRYAEVLGIDVRSREELFPGEPAGARAGKQYYRLMVGPILTRDRPIAIVRPRPIAFINTTWRKFTSAVTVNDLFSESPLEERLWREFKRTGIPAERQWPETAGKKRYVLDFALFCHDGKVDVETDGDSYHANSERSVIDNERNNRLSTLGWRILRFNTSQIRDQLDECLGRVGAIVNRLGGIADDGLVPRRFLAESAGLATQLSLFESPSPYDAPDS